MSRLGVLRSRKRRAFARLFFAASLVVSIPVAHAAADAWTLIASPGTCSYTYDRISDERTTTCVATAVLLNTQTSDVVHCRATVEGNQFLAPSVEENVPDAVTCWSSGRVLNAEGTFGIASLDDRFVDENTRIRRRGTFAWSNAFWVYSTSGEFSIRVCAAAREIQNPDFAQRCSTDISWRAGPISSTAE